MFYIVNVLLAMQVPVLVAIQWLAVWAVGLVNNLSRLRDNLQQRVGWLCGLQCFHQHIEHTPERWANTSLPALGAAGEKLGDVADALASAADVWPEAGTPIYDAKAALQPLTAAVESAGAASWRRLDGSPIDVRQGSGSPWRLLGT